MDKHNFRDVGLLSSMQLVSGKHGLRMDFGLESILHRLRLRLLYLRFCSKSWQIWFRRSGTMSIMYDLSDYSISVVFSRWMLYGIVGSPSGCYIYISIQLFPPSDRLEQQSAIFWVVIVFSKHQHTMMRNVMEVLSGRCFEKSFVISDRFSESKAFWSLLRKVARNIGLIFRTKAVLVVALSQYQIVFQKKNCIQHICTWEAM